MAKSRAQIQAESDARRGQVVVGVKVDQDVAEKFAELAKRYGSKKAAFTAAVELLKHTQN